MTSPSRCFDPNEFRKIHQLALEMLIRPWQNTYGFSPDMGIRGINFSRYYPKDQREVCKYNGKEIKFVHSTLCFSVGVSSSFINKHIIYYIVYFLLIISNSYHKTWF